MCGLSDDFEMPEPSDLAREVLGTALAFVDFYDMARDYLEQEG